MRRLLPFVLVTGCFGPPEPPIDGDYTRAAYHLVAMCPDGNVRLLDYLYPANTAASTFRFEEHAEGRVTLSWGTREIAAGSRESDGSVALSFRQRDPFSAEVSWDFRGRVRDDFRFHERTIVGRVERGQVVTNGQTCEIAPRSVAWFTTKPRSLDERAFSPRRDAAAHGDWARFVWFLDAGPYAMTRKGDPGQRGENLRMFSFASTGGGRITAGDDAAFFENGFGTWLGAASGRSVAFPQHESAWELDFSQDVIWDDGRSGVGIRRVLAGFVTGTYRVNESDYPAGWEGETGLLPLVTPGFSYWLDFERGDIPEALLERDVVVRFGDREWTP